MDYNYVRMRNALKNGELEKAEEYKLLYEGKKNKKKSLSVLDYTIIFFLCIAVSLGVYILHSQSKITESNSATVEETVEGENGK